MVEGKWTKIFTPMPTARLNPAAIVVGESLFVIGGEDIQERPLAVVEVMNTETHQWHILVPLPEPLVNAFIVAYGSQIFVLGGRGEMLSERHSCFVAVLPS